MGLHSQLNDVSSDSLPFLLLALIATFVTRLRSLLPSHATVSSTDGGALSAPFSAKDQDNDNDEGEDDDVDGKDNCVFCLSGLREGDRVRELTCRHVFHTDCLDGWIGQMKFSCPLCRSPLVSDWRVDRLCRRVGSNLSAWFAVR